MEIQNNPANHLQTISVLEAFIEEHQDRLVNHAFYRLGNRQDAEDVVQDVFIKMFSGKAKNGAICNPAAYAWRMVANSCINELRARNKDNKLTLDEETISVTASSDNKEAEIILQEDFERINRLLDTLPFEQAEVLRFRFTDELTFTDIAGILEIPVTTVKSRFKYGLDKVKTQFFNQKEVIHAL